MGTKITIQIDEISKISDIQSPSTSILSTDAMAGGAPISVLDAKVNEIIAQQGDEIASFPKAKMGGYLSHFMIVLELYDGSYKGRSISINSPLASQSVAWGNAFVYEGPTAAHEVRVPLPVGSKLPSTIREDDFLIKPAEYFEKGKEMLWLQILNLDAHMETEIGSVRIILGETLKREYPDIFKPSLGAAQSLGSGGFPARLYFNPYAIIETPIGAFRAVHGTLSYGRVTAFPPVGTPVSICECIPLEPVDEVVKFMTEGRPESLIEPVGRIIALSHPIDMEMQLSGEEAYHYCERCIATFANEKDK